MSGIAVDILLVLAVAACWLGTAAFVFLRTPYDRLHAAGYVVVASGLFVTLAVIAPNPLSTSSLKTVIIYAGFVLTGAILNHSIGRALRLRDESADRP